jgi:hypothetical protein
MAANEETADGTPRRPFRAPMLCSQCLQPPRPKGGFHVTEIGDKGPFLLCCLRCMCLWAMSRGWAK